MPIAPTSPGVSTRTRSKSALKTKTDAESTTVATISTLGRVPKEKAEKAPSKKRKRDIDSPANRKVVSTHQASNEEEVVSPLKKKKKTKTTDCPENNETEEKRLRLFRQKAPQSYLVRLSRATSQRMFVIGRTRSGTDSIPQETIEIAGTTGNLYHVNIGLLPSCTCPDNKNGNQCKHIIYVLRNVLKVPSSSLQYQLAFLSSELREIFSHAPPPASSTASPSSPYNRKEVSGDCPICFTPFEPENEAIVWCKAACGNNIHKTCFEQWAKSLGPRGKVRCVFCREVWQGDEISVKNIKTKGQLNEEGYVNVGDQLGLPSTRDDSTYHYPPYWARRGQRYC